MPSQAMMQFTTFAVPAPQSTDGTWQRSQLLEYIGQQFDLPLHSWVTDGSGPMHLGAPTNEDLGLVGGTFGTDGHSIQSVDEKNNGAEHSCRAINTFMLPANYPHGSTLQIALRAGMATTVASTSAVVDIEVYKLDADGEPTGSDICTTAAQAINSLILATKTFTLSPIGLVAGNKLMIRLTTTVNDAATATAVIAQVTKTVVLCALQG